MKKVFALTTIVSISFSTFACDICGCGVGSYYIGILPDFNKRFVGLRYQSKGMTTHLTASGNRSYLTTDEHYRVLELWGAWNIGKKFRIVAFVPFNNVERENSGTSSAKSGIGDMAFVAYYNLFSNESTTDHQPKRVVQSLWAGGGAKIPTGHYNPSDQSVSSQALNTFQLGTGSVDFTLNAMYDLRIQDAGINTNISYKINTTNNYDYTYGNKLSGNVLAYYKWRIANIMTVAPNAGLMYERSKEDLTTQNFKVDLSGGYTLMGAIGIEASLKRYSFGGNYQTPVSQNLANGIVKTNDRYMVHMSVAF